MDHRVTHLHIRDRLKRFHIISVIGLTLLFGIVFTIGLTTDVDTLIAQMTLLGMAGLMGVGYLGLLLPTDREPFLPLVLYVILNVLNTILVWATGILASPFVIFYVVLIIATTQMYRYWSGLLQAVLAFVGFVTIYEATVAQLLPYQSLLVDSEIGILSQPAIVILTYGLLYAILLLFTVLASSPARMMLYRPHDRVDMDVTYQEKIIQEMPLAVFVVDADMMILGTNPAADANYPLTPSDRSLASYVSTEQAALEKKLIQMTRTGKEVVFAWKTDTGEQRNVLLSARKIRGEKTKGTTYVVFLRAA